MKKVKRIVLIMFLYVLLIYVTNINTIPDNIILFKGEDLNLNTVFGIYYNEDIESIETGVSVNKENVVEKRKISVKLFNIINIKDIEINTIPKTTVIPLGNAVGLKLYTNGVLVVGMTEIQGKKPYQNSGLEEGDMIIEINEEEVTSTLELINSVNNSRRGKSKHKICKRWKRVYNHNGTNKNQR